MEVWHLLQFFSSELSSHSLLWLHFWYFWIHFLPSSHWNSDSWNEKHKLFWDGSLLNTWPATTWVVTRGGHQGTRRGKPMNYIVKYTFCMHHTWRIVRVFTRVHSVIVTSNENAFSQSHCLVSKNLQKICFYCERDMQLFIFAIFKETFKQTSKNRFKYQPSRIDVM